MVKLRLVAALLAAAIVTAGWLGLQAGQAGPVGTLATPRPSRPSCPFPKTMVMLTASPAG
jgi:hypothetical protein